MYIPCIQLFGILHRLSTIAWHDFLPRHNRSGIVAIIVLLPVLAIAGPSELDQGEQLYTEHCAVCHGTDLGGYIGPALNRESLATSTEAQLRAKITTGGVGTLMPRHPTTWFGRLSSDEVQQLASFIRNTPIKTGLGWGLEDIRSSLTVLAAESTLPQHPDYPIEDMDDLMTVTARGRFSAGEDAKVVFFNGRTNEKVGELTTNFAPHLVDYHPTEDRWAYVTTDAGYLFKVDLYSFKAVRSVRVGLNGASLAVSRDGRYVAAGAYIPNTAVILDAYTLEPVKFFELRGVDPDGKMVEADSGVILGTPYADYFVMALEQSGQVWVVDLADSDFPVIRIEKVGRHLHDAFLSPGGRYIAMSSYDDNVIAVIDLENKEVIKRMPAGRQPHLGSGAIVEVDGRTLGIGTNIGVDVTGETLVTVFDMDTFEVIRQIPVLGPTESPAAHPDAPYIVVDIVGTGADAAKIQFIDKKTLEVVNTITVGGHSHFPEYTARGDYLYVSAGYSGDRLVIYDAQTLEMVKKVKMEAPAGIFSHARSRVVTIGLEKALQ